MIASLICSCVQLKVPLKLWPGRVGYRWVIRITPLQSHLPLGASHQPCDIRKAARRLGELNVPK